jgi:hypothetical protein
MTRRRLVFDVYVEEYVVHRVMRQFGLFQAASTRCTTSAAYRAQVSYHLTVLSIFHYEYSVANNFMFHVLC